MLRRIFESYRDLIYLLFGITIGSLLGIFMPNVIDILKPIGDIFLNLLFVAVVPLLFFAITSSILQIEDSNRLSKIVSVMAAVFVSTIVIASLVTILGLWLYPVDAHFEDTTQQQLVENNDEKSWGDKVVSLFSVGEFGNLLSRQNILALVIFSILVGIAARKTGDLAKSFNNFILSGNQVMQQLMKLIMIIAPVGLGVYFGYQLKTLGPQLFGLYAKPLGFYYVFGSVFFIVFFSLYAFIARGKEGVITYWTFNIRPTLTALSTCSSLATLPSNIQASKKMGISSAVANTVIPIGSTLYKNGSALSSILKIYVAFAILGWNFFEPTTLITAVGITLLVSMVAGGIPNGGFIGEMLMISVYDIPKEAVPSVLIIGALVDPLATILNATGDTVAAMLVERFTDSKRKIS